MGRPAALRAARPHNAASHASRGRDVGKPRPAARAVSARKRLTVRAASRNLVPVSQNGTGLQRAAEQWRDLAQYGSVEAMEATVSRQDLSYEDKVRWLAKYYSLRPLQVGGRLAKVLALGARAAITWVMEERLPEGAQRHRGEVLRDALSSLGPVFVKVGQTLATRPDIVGDEAAEYLTQLQEKNKPFPSTKAFAIIRDEFDWNGPLAGNHLEGISSPGERPLFAELGEEPVAAASLGQVYQGRMMPSAEGEEGLPVAVKVMRPGVGRQIALDVHIIRLVLKWLQLYWGTEAELPNISNEVGAGLFRELDYHQEAQNIEEFRDAHAFQHFLRIPTTFPGWTTQRVLCMEWVEGKRKSQLDDREKLAMVKMGVDCCMAQLLQTGIIHADPHDGNMMLSGQDELCLLDFGLVTKITVEQQEAMASAILHTLAEEWAMLVEDMKIMGLLPEVPAIWIDPVTGEQTSPLQQGVWKEMPEEEFTAVFTASMTSGGKQRSFSQITEQLCELGASYKVNLPTWLVLIIRSMLTLDGFASAMNYNPIEAAYPHAIRRALAPVTQRGRDALQAALLTESGDVNWPRLTNLLGNDDALRDAAKENAARAEEAILASASHEERYEELHMDAAEEAKRVVQELMVSCEGKPLRRLMYSANTSSIVARLFAKDAFQAALGQAAGITTVFRLAAAQIEANVAKSFRRAARAIRLGKARDSDARRSAGRSSWRAAAVYGVLARHHASQLLRCGPKGVATAVGLSMAAILIGTVASAMALVNTVARIPRLVIGRGRSSASADRDGAPTAGPMAATGERLPLLQITPPASTTRRGWQDPPMDAAVAM